MAENTTFDFGENSPESVAYKLMHDIARAEKKRMVSVMGTDPDVTREWIIKTYCQCLAAVRNPNRPSDAFDMYNPN